MNKAISTATDKSSIYVQAGYYVGTSNTVLTISKNLTIYGDGSAVFSGENSRQSGFTVNTGYAVTCNGLKFINGGGNAGAVTVNDNCSIINCTFQNNLKSTSTDNENSWGGAVYCIGSKNLIFNSNFYSNKAYSGGGIYNGSLNNTVTDCTFSNNASSNGGGIYINGNNDNVKNCTFKNNTPTNLYVQGTYSGTITNCYWGTDTPTSANWGTTIGNYTATNNATSKTVYNIIKYTKASVSSGTNIPLTFKCLDCNGNPLSNMEIVLKNGTTTLATLTTDNNGLSTYSVTVTASMSLTITNTAKDNYNSCTSETRTITSK